MATPSPADLTAFGVMLLAGACCLRCEFAVRNHLRQHHPLVFSRFGFPPSSPFADTQDEAADVRAGSMLDGYLRGRGWRQLGDPRLERLLLARNVSRWCFMATILVSVVVFFSFLGKTA